MNLISQNGLLKMMLEKLLEIPPRSAKLKEQVVAYIIHH